MIIRRSKYAIRALLAVVRQGPGQSLSVEAIARTEQLPRKYLEAIMLDLKVAGLVQSARGKGGGYTLLKSPSRITMGQIIRAVQGPMSPARCVSATAYSSCEDCPSEELCCVRPLMRDLREALSRVIDLKTLAALAAETESLTASRSAEFHI